MPADDPLRPFRGRRARVVASVMGALALVVFVGLAVLLPTDAGERTWGVTDRVMISLLGVGIALICWRYATIKAVPTLDGLTVRNLVLTRSVAWEQVVDVEFGGGAPWVTLELDDTDTLAVMAIQRADGPSALEEARRLAGLVRDLGEGRERA